MAFWMMLPAYDECEWLCHELTYVSSVNVNPIRPALLDDLSTDLDEG